MLIELHLHTDESSNCGKVKAEDAIREYARRGYGAVVITDHFNRGNFSKLNYTNDRQRVDCFLKGYRTAKEA